MIKAYWWQEGGNFGDLITPHLCEHLSGQRVEHAPPHEADILAAGSILEPHFWPERSWKRYGGYVWGTGRMFAARPIRMEAATVLAVRGHGTLAGLECASKETVFLGDPGLLCDLFARRTAKRYKLGVIPHATERDHPNIRELVSQSGEIHFIDVCAPFHEVIEAAGQCEHIVSSALHGLVLADALEIPNRWLWVDDTDRDLLGKPEFKYRDYYSAFGMADMSYIRLTGEDSLNTILPRIFPYSRPGLGHLQRGLGETFPFGR